MERRDVSRGRKGHAREALHAWDERGRLSEAGCRGDLRLERACDVRLDDDADDSCLQQNPRSKYYLTPYYIILWGTTAGTS